MDVLRIGNGPFAAIRPGTNALPAGETAGDARLMVRPGCRRDPAADGIIGQHANPRYPAGTFFARAGCVSGFGDDVLPAVRGCSGHSAYPGSGPGGAGGRADDPPGEMSFAFFLDDTPGVFYDIGCGVGFALRTDVFRVDDATPLPGEALQRAAVRSTLPSS
ncbi:MAG: hypothetical protein ACI4O7_08655 [Aristaeellaceae bacterium]